MAAAEEDVTAVLVTLVAEYGVDLARDATRCRGLLNDSLGARGMDRRREVTALVTAVEEGSAGELADDTSNAPFRVGPLATRLEDNRGVSPEVARWALASWAKALGAPVSVPPIDRSAADTTLGPPSHEVELTGTTARRPSRRTIAFATGAGVIIAIVIAVIASSGGGGGSGDNTDASKSSSSTSSAGVREVSVFELRKGQCFDHPAPVGDSVATFSTARIVPCSEPHDAEIFGMFDYPAGEHAPFAGDDRLSTYAREQCNLTYQQVEPASPPSDLHIERFWPNAGGWETGQRTILCAATRGNAGQLTGSLLGGR